MTNYRPVSFLMIFSKVLEKATHCRLSQRPQSNVMLYVAVLIAHWPYTGCTRRNVQEFGRVFLMLNYTDINQNFYKTCSGDT
jgi:hypothetical protein